MKREIYIAISIIVVLIGVGLALMPAISDDLLFGFACRDYLVDGLPLSLKSIFNGFSYAYFNNNARLSNMVLVLMLLLPRIVAAIGSSLCLAYILIKGARLAGIEKSGYLCMAWTAYIVICLPWADQLYLIAFQLNYIWSAAMALYIIAAFMQRDRHRILWPCIASVILGAWHEGFAVPTLLSMLTIAAFFKEYRTRQTATLLIALSLGMIYLFTSPTFRTSPTEYFQHRMAIVYPYLLPFVIALVISVYMLIRKQLSRQVMIKALSLMIPAFISAALMIYSQQGARVGTLSIIYSGLTILMFVPKSNKYKTFAAVIFLLTAAHLIAVDLQAYKSYADTKRVLSIYAKSPDEIIYSDMTLRENAPWYCLQKPYYGWFAHNSTLYFIEGFYSHFQHELLVLPSELKHFSTDKAEKIDGNASAYYYRGLTVLPIDIRHRTVRDFSADYGMGARNRQFMLMPFVCGADSCHYVWAYPENTWLDHSLSPRPLSFSTTPRAR